MSRQKHQTQKNFELLKRNAENLKERKRVKKNIEKEQKSESGFIDINYRIKIASILLVLAILAKIILTSFLFVVSLIIYGILLSLILSRKYINNLNFELSKLIGISISITLIIMTFIETNFIPREALDYGLSHEIAGTLRNDLIIISLFPIIIGLFYSYLLFVNKR